VKHSPSGWDFWAAEPGPSPSPLRSAGKTMNSTCCRGHGANIFCPTKPLSVSTFTVKKSVPTMTAM
jgi:hypothetical protein